MSENLAKKRERGANYTPEEKTIFMDLITQYKHCIEDKRTGGHIINKKKDAWKAITIKYNSNCTTGPRQMEQLKALYDNMKQKSRKAVGENNKLEYTKLLLKKKTDVSVANDDLATALLHQKQDKVEIQKTGGGSWKPTVTDSDAKILAIIQDQVEPLSNPYDSGAVYFKDQQTKEVSELDPEPPARDISELEIGIVTDTSEWPVEDYYVPSPSTAAQDQQQDTNSLLVTTPSRGTPTITAQRRLPKNKAVPKTIRKRNSAEGYKRIYFKKKCENAYLERKKLIQELLFQKEEHKLKMAILKNRLVKKKK